jgi:hypothetical protein
MTGMRLGSRLCAVALILAVSSGLAPASAAVNLASSTRIRPDRVIAGGTVAINAAFNSADPLENVNVAVEVRSPAGERVFQQVIPAQTFVPGRDYAYAARWSVPRDLTPGLYSVQIGAFSSDWSTSYSWNERAGLVTVTDSFVGFVPTAYYVDCLLGNDSNAGTVAGDAWASLARANEALLQPGDFLRLRRGCTWTGPLLASWNGTQLHPITIEAYGSGSLPEIQNDDFAQVNIKGSFLVFDSLHVRSDPAFIDESCKNNRIGYRLGFFFAPGSSNNVLKNSLIEDTGAGVDIGPGSYGNTITQNEFLNNNMMWDVDPWLNDGGANGILIEGDSNDVSYNHISGSIVCSIRYPADGSAFELTGATNNRIHHNRVGGNWTFAEVSQSTNNDFAYNISTDSGFTNHATSIGTRLFNNVFYVPGGGIVSCFPCQEGGLALVNNIIFADIALYTDGPIVEHNNVYWRPGVGSPSMTITRDPSSKVADPMFVDPATGDFHLRAGSPAINAGSAESIDAGFSQDMDGTSVPIGPAVDIGNFERE